MIYVASFRPVRAIELNSVSENQERKRKKKEKKRRRKLPEEM